MVIEDTVYVGVTETANVVTIPILSDGSAGVAKIFGHAGTSVDGIAVDIEGNVYVAAVFSNSIVRINTDGSVETISESELLDNPSSLVFGNGDRDTQSLYVTNFPIGLADTASGAGPSVVRIDVGILGAPLP